MLQNAYFLAKIGAYTAEIELHFAEMLPIGRQRSDGEEGCRRGARQRAEDLVDVRPEAAPGPEGPAVDDLRCESGIQAA